MDFKNSWVGGILMFINMFVLIVVMILLMVVGAYHLLFEEPPSEKLPYAVVVYDRSNKAIISYDAVCEVKDGKLYLYDATEVGREDVSHLVE